MADRDSAPASAQLRSVAFVLAQLVLAWGLVQAFRLESASFRAGLAALIVAYPVHAALPISARLPFFALLGVGSILAVCGLNAGAWILGLGGGLVALVHLPVPFAVRMALLAAAAVGLGVLRSLPPALAPVQVPGLAWPVLASMFMFRLLIYVYDLRNRSAPFGFWRAVAYFFMPPNVWFPLFPIVDYQAMQRPVPSAERFTGHQAGADWIIRGIIQLILYRLVYQNFLVDPATIDGPARLTQAMVGTFLLYLRISGSFHLIVGLLRLFDFALPETHHRYFLASSFSDFWRRINIYWKDFVMKLVFYPVFFRLRRIDPARALVPATLLAFAATWALHSWQWFWMHGEFLLTASDTLFWILLALLVTVNVVRESRPGSRRTKRTAGAQLRRALATMATFAVLTLLWSFWNAGSWREFALLFDGLAVRGPADILVPVGVLVVVGAWSLLDARTSRLHGLAAAGKVNSAKPALVNGALGAGLLLLAIDAVQVRLPGPFSTTVARLEEATINDRDLALLQRGYYEDLTRVDRFSHELAIVYGERPPDYFVPWREALRDETDDYFGEVLKPSARTTYMDVTYTTNAHGLRDREYAPETTPGLSRVALVGSSYTLGWGVGDDATFEAIAERRLADSGAPAEILNFAVHAYDPVRNLLVLEQRVLPFRPDAVLLFCNTNERKTLVSNLAHAVANGIPLPYPFLEELRIRAGVDKDTDRGVMEVRLAAVADEAILATWTRFAATCRDAGIVSAWLFMPETKARVAASATGSVEELYAMARRAGFDVVSDLAPAFDGVEGETLKLFPWDFHPNARGHELLAGEFLRAYRRDIAPRIAGGSAPADSVSAPPPSPEGPTGAPRR